MRAIDGEWLAGELFKVHVHDDEDLEPLVYLSDAQKLINTAPIIHAIPVEWINWRIKNADKNGFKDAAQAMRWVLWCWENQEEEGQKEQEAKE